MRADNCRVSRNGNERSSPNGGQSRKSGRSSFFIVSVRNSNAAKSVSGGEQKKKLIVSFLCVAVVGFIIFLPFLTLSVHFTLQILMMESTSQQLLGRPKNLPRPPV